VESIGEATGRSGAAVYQYFEGKSEIFGIFLREVGAELREVSEQFPVITEDEAGQRALQAWIASLVNVLDRHQGTFLLWAQVQFNEPSLTEIGRWNLDQFQTNIAERLVRSGAHPPTTPNIVPLGMMSVIQWSFYISIAGAPQVAREQLERALAEVLHAYLFAPPETADPAPIAGLDVGQMPRIPLGDAMGLRRPVTARGVGTVQRILLAAADRLRGSGYYGTSLTDIATGAGVSHGSVYTYWADREALFTTLAQDAVAGVEARVATLDEAIRTPDAMVAWLDGWISMLGVHGAVMYVLTHEVDLPAIADLTARMNNALDAASAAFVDLSDSSSIHDPDAMRIVLRAVLTDVPYVLSTQLGILPRETALGFVTGLLRGGVRAPALDQSDR